MTQVLTFDEAALAKLEAGSGIGAGREFVSAPENQVAAKAKTKAKVRATAASAKQRHPAD